MLERYLAEKNNGVVDERRVQEIYSTLDATPLVLADILEQDPDRSPDRPEKGIAVVPVRGEIGARFTQNPTEEALGVNALRARLSRLADEINFTNPESIVCDAFTKLGFPLRLEPGEVAVVDVRDTLGNLSIPDAFAFVDNSPTDLTAGPENRFKAEVKLIEKIFKQLESDYYVISFPPLNEEKGFPQATTANFLLTFATGASEAVGVLDVNARDARRNLSPAPKLSFFEIAYLSGEAYDQARETRLTIRRLLKDKYFLND
jgi:hypothetical protein